MLPPFFKHMEIKYFFQNISLSDELRDLIEEKIQKFSRLTDKIWEAKVDLSYSPGHGKGHKLTHLKSEKFRLEINLRLPNKILRGVARARDLRRAIDEVEKKLTRQLRKYKTFGEVKKKKNSRNYQKRKVNVN